MKTLSADELAYLERQCGYNRTPCNERCLSPGYFVPYSPGGVFDMGNELIKRSLLESFDCQLLTNSYHRHITERGRAAISIHKLILSLSDLKLDGEVQ